MLKGINQHCHQKPKASFEIFVQENKAKREIVTGKIFEMKQSLLDHAPHRKSTKRKLEKLHAVESVKPATTEEVATGEKSSKSAKLLHIIDSKFARWVRGKVGSATKSIYEGSVALVWSPVTFQMASFDRTKKMLHREPSDVTVVTGELQKLAFLATYNDESAGSEEVVKGSDAKEEKEIRDELYRLTFLSLSSSSRIKKSGLLTRLKENKVSKALTWGVRSTATKTGGVLAQILYYNLKILVMVPKMLLKGDVRIVRKMRSDNGPPKSDLLLGELRKRIFLPLKMVFYPPGWVVKEIFTAPINK